MISQWFWSIERAAGLFLVLGFVANLAGVLMFTFLGGLGGNRGGTPLSSTLLVWERSFIIAAVVLTAIGFVLLEGRLYDTDGRILVRAGATTYLFAGILLVAAEGLNLSGRFEIPYALIVIYVVLAFLAQAAIGGALLQSGLLPAWIGLVVILWSLAWPVVLLITTPSDIYFPALHHLMPLLIGSALLWRAP